MQLSDERLKFLRLLSDTYKNVNQASTEIINLQAILNLPKGTEHFISDIHGEYESFSHVLRNASGVIKNYISELFGETLMDHEKRALATLIYYPEEKLEIINKTGTDMYEWYKVTLFRLVSICKRVSTKYTRSKVRKALPTEFAYIIEELIHEDHNRMHKDSYYREIISSIIRLDRADEFIAALARLIQRMAIDHLHVIGDIYDRGPGAYRIMETLMNYHSLDIQWGNHDVLWMGAARGGEALIFNALRVSARYNNLDTIEDFYGINLVPLATFALDTYKESSVERFIPWGDNQGESEKQLDMVARMHKAAFIIQLKLEAEIIRRRPEYEMGDRVLLDKIDFDRKTISLDGAEYELIDLDYPTLSPENPFALTADERDVVDKLKKSFKNSLKLQEHVKFLFSKGSMYKKYNGNLLLHGGIPMEPDGSFKTVGFTGKPLSGRALLDEAELAVRRGCFSKNGEERLKGLDLMWYLWCGPASPLFGKNKMATFESYFIADKKAREEKKDLYYDMRNDRAVCEKILESFGLDPDKSHIINGHVPVKVSKGESPLKAGGKLIVIDGGFARAYQSVTGIAGYTLIFNSIGLQLASHQPFTSAEDAVANESDIDSSYNVVENKTARIRVFDTDIGGELKGRIDDLKELLYCYRAGLFKER